MISLQQLVPDEIFVQVGETCIFMRVPDGVILCLFITGSHCIVLQSRFADALLRELAGVSIPPERIYGLGTG